MSLHNFIKFGVIPSSKLQNGVIINNVGGNLVATASGGEFNTADYVVYDWRKDGESIALVNMPFKENVITPKDYTNNNYTIANNGTSLATFNASGGSDGKGAFVFNGGGANSNKIDLGQAILVSGTQEYTQFVSLKMDTVSEQMIVGQYTPSGNRFLFYITSGKLRYFIAGNSISSINVIPTGTYTTTAFTKDENQLVKLYLNNTEENSFINATSYKNENYSIGGNSNTIATFDGEIEYCLLYDRSLSSEQLTFLENKEFNKIASQELSTGSWNVVATPITGGNAGTPVESDEIDIKYYHQYSAENVLNGSDITPSNGENIAKWKKTTNTIGGTLLPADANNCTYVSDFANFKPSVNFSSNSAKMTIAEQTIFNNKSSCTIFMVAKVIGDKNYLTSPIKIGAPSGAGQNNIEILPNGMTSSLSNTGDGLAGFISNKLLIIGSKVKSGNEPLFYINGSVYNANVGDTCDGILNSSSITIGAGGQPGRGATEGDIAEVLFYPVELSDIEVKKTQSYLAYKYAITFDYNTADQDYVNLTNGDVIRTIESVYTNMVCALVKNNKYQINITKCQGYEIYVPANKDAIIIQHTDVNGNEIDILEDDIYFTFGNNNADTTTLNQGYNGGINNGISRIWKVANAGNFASLYITIDTTNIVASINKIVISSNPTFPSGSTNEFTIVGNKATIQFATATDVLPEYFSFIN